MCPHTLAAADGGVGADASHRGKQVAQAIAGQTAWAAPHTKASYFRAQHKRAIK